MLKMVLAFSLLSSLLVSAPLLARSLDDFEYNIIDRPLVLGQEIFERSLTTTLMYYKYSSNNDDNSYYYDDDVDTDNHLGNVSSTLWLAVGLTDRLQLGLAGTMSLKDPKNEFIRPTIEIAGLALKNVAPRFRIILPDTLDDEAYGWAAGVTGRSQLIPRKMAVLVDLDLEKYESSAGYGTSVGLKTLQGSVGLRYAFVPKFFVGCFGGFSKSWVSLEDSDYDMDDPDATVRYGIELGFTSEKHIDMVLRWGSPGNSNDAFDSIHFASLSLVGRL